MNELKEILSAAWSEVGTSKNVEGLDRLFHPSFVRHGSRDHSLTEFKDLVQQLHTGFPDLEQQMLDFVQDGDRVAYRWEAVGTHLGPYLGALPTGRRIHARGITISRFEGNQVVEDWASWNELSVLHDIGIMPIDR